MKTAILLAAGRGRRLQGRAGAQPKCMAELAGRPLLHWQRDAFERAGLCRRVVVTGFAAERVPLLAGESGVHCADWDSGGPLGSLLCVAPAVLEQGFVLGYGDCVWRAEWLRRLRTQPGDLVLPADRRWAELWRERWQHPLQDAESFRSAGGMLLEIGAPAAGMDLVEAQFMGLLGVRPAGWRCMHATIARLGAQRARRMDLTGLLAEMLQDGAEIRVLPVDGGWIELDTPQDLALYRRRLAAAGDWTHDWRDRAG